VEGNSGRYVGNVGVTDLGRCAVSDFLLYSKSMLSTALSESVILTTRTNSLIRTELMTLTQKVKIAPSLSLTVKHFSKAHFGS